MISDSLPGSPAAATQALEESPIPYAWVILFTNNVDTDSPFNMLRLTHFQNSDFPWDCIRSEMSQQFRLGLRTLSNMPGSKYYIFAKVERGE